MTNEDRQIAEGCVRMRGNEAWQLAVMRAQGREEEVQSYVAELNRCRRICGAPPFAVPEPASTGLRDWLVCPTTEPKEIGEGRVQVAA